MRLKFFCGFVIEEDGCVRRGDRMGVFIRHHKHGLQHEALLRCLPICPWQ